ncbi:MAG: tripartite tricarboxylate transporter substrate binding protein [Xanthobacteraceae bacterium]|nr:tripartite tricarboxylate transporter substrate binding protein [Xanthobacteraceae bacterium]
MFRLLIASLCVALAAPALAQDYPSRPVKIVFPLAPGGGGDVFSRALADELSKLWHQPVLVENRPGGGQNIGARACAEAAPDGYTICVMSSEPAVYNEFLYKTIPYNPEKDFQPVANLFFNTLSVVVNSDLKVKSLAELIALAKSRHETRQGLSYATFSFPLTVFMEKLKKKEGIDVVKVPYRGGGDVVNAVLGGTTPIALLALSNMVPQIQSGRITLLAVNSNARSPLFPDAPTLKEAYGDDAPPTWFGLFTPAGVPRPIVEKIARDADRIMAEPAFRKRIYTDRAVEPALERLDDFARFIAAERKIARQIVQDSGEQPK